MEVFFNMEMFNKVFVVVVNCLIEFDFMEILYDCVFLFDLFNFEILLNFLQVN